MTEKSTPVEVGQEVYVPTRMYIEQGHLDIAGGLATVSKIEMSMSAGRDVPFIGVKEIPGRLFNWEILASDQEKFRTEYGDQRARPDPDCYWA